MDWLHNKLWQDGHLSWWIIVGWLANVLFFSRFLVQWYATEKKKRVVVPTAFWWLSLGGSLLFLGYAMFYKHDVVLIFAFAFNWIPYVRNLIIHRRHKLALQNCPSCGKSSAPEAAYCSDCGTRLEKQPVTVA